MQREGNMNFNTSLLHAGVDRNECKGATLTPIYQSSAFEQSTAADLEAFGITTRYVENNNWEEIEAAFNENTRAFFAETIGNPRLDVTDVEKLADICHKHNVPLIVDNTVATAYLYKPLEHGADISKFFFQIYKWKQ